MRSAFTESLRCPGCRGTLALRAYKSVAEGEITDGLMLCHCGKAFAVWQGIPRMRLDEPLPADFAQAYGEAIRRDAGRAAVEGRREKPRRFSFSHQWSMHSYDSLTWEMYLPERVGVFFKYFALRPDEAKDLRLLDAGCGNGTLSAQLAAEGMQVVGMDYSDSVARAHQRKLFEPSLTSQAVSRVEYLQGDVANPPFAEGTFDLIYSDGVLHHTPNTKTSFMALAPLVRPDGRFLVWLYRSDTRPGITLKNYLVKVIRVLTRGLPYGAKTAVCYAGAVVLAGATRAANALGHRRRRPIPMSLKALNLFDTISPRFNHEHTPDEVREWFEEAGYGDIRDVSIAEYRLDEAGFAMVGTRRGRR